MKQVDFEIVCVDDDSDVLEITAFNVTESGYKEVSFTKPEDAHNYIVNNKQKIAMILSDLRMDETNGFEFKKRLPSNTSDIPFVILTGYWTKEMSLDAMEVGVSAFIEKPASQEKISEIIEQFAASRRELLLEEQDMVDGFLEESSPMLEEIEAIILELEDAPDKEQTLSVYFRLLHTIKGTASCVGLTKLGDYTHKYEDFVTDLRNGKVPISVGSINILLAGLDDLKNLFEAISKASSDEEIDISEMLKLYSDENLENLLSKEIAEVNNSTRASDDPVKSNTEKRDDEKMLVPMGILNNFMEESGELTVIRNSILKTVRKIEVKYRGDAEIELLNELLNAMHVVTSNIQGKIVEMRKVPLTTTFRPFKRLVRDLSKKLNKKVNLEFEGDSLTVDTVIAKLYSNTMIHLLRNSLDHGLEEIEARVAAGKSEEGTLKIVIVETGEDIVLSIQDDGNGIDPIFIGQKAVEKGLYTEDEISLMSDLEIINIIFHSGFSTAENVSAISGRGVGMDMVRGSFLEMDGNVFVQSTPGEGSTFNLSVPIPKSVLIVNALLVTSAKNHFIFHMDEVAEVIRYSSENQNSKMYEIDGQKLFCHNDEMLELISLSSSLGLSENAEEDCDNIVVLRIDDRKFGVIVDEIHEFEEVVSRKIPSGVSNSEIYHGASLLGTGDIALIVSAEGIAIYNNLKIEKRVATSSGEPIEETQTFCNEYMLFKYNETQFLSIELDDVVRLETLNTNMLQMTGAKYLVRYRDSVLPVVDPAYILGLNKEFRLENLANLDDHPLEVIVVNIKGVQVGLLVYELDDIQYSHDELCRDSSKMKGLKGSTYINGRTICVVDLEYVYFESQKRISFKKKSAEKIPRPSECVA